MRKSSFLDIYLGCRMKWSKYIVALILIAIALPFEDYFLFKNNKLIFFKETNFPSFEISNPVFLNIAKNSNSFKINLKAKILRSLFTSGFSKGSFFIVNDKLPLLMTDINHRCPSEMIPVFEKESSELVCHSSNKYFSFKDNKTYSVYNIATLKGKIANNIFEVEFQCKQPDGIRCLTSGWNILDPQIEYLNSIYKCEDLNGAKNILEPDGLSKLNFIPTPMIYQMMKCLEKNQESELYKLLLHLAILHKKFL